MYTIEDQIKDTLDKIRPFIQRDGGDVLFVRYEESTGTVYIKLLGACEGCAAIDETLQYGVGVLLQEEVPGVVDVKSVKNDENN